MRPARWIGEAAITAGGAPGGSVRLRGLGGAARLAALYALFAALATAANLAAQRAALAAYDGPAELVFAVALGTGVGLVVKYALDKRWIFRDPGRGLGAHRRKLSRYTLTGVATTAIFWGFEFGFHLIWGTDAMRELGAVIGLAIGYTLKYRLDRRFVFETQAEARAPC